MLITRLPLVCHDETLYSFAARTRLANAARDDHDACCALFGPSATMCIAAFPVNLEYFCRKTKGALGGPNDVLESMTLTGFYDRIGSHPWHAGSSRLPVAIAGYGLAPLSNGDGHTWRVCDRCLEADLSATGTSHWRRVHQLPTAFFCIAHGVELNTSSVPRTEGQHHFYLPQDTVLSRPYGAKRAEEIETMWRLTKLAVDALYHAGPAIDLALAHETMLRTLANRGLLTAGGSIRPDQFVRELTHDYGFLSRYAAFADAVSARGLDILHRSMHSAAIWRRPVHSLLLIDFLFGPWHAFDQQCAWQSVMDYPMENTYQDCGCATGKPNESYPDPDNVGKTQSAHRLACMDFVESQVTATRSRFARAAPKSFRWLLRNDAAWFDQVCSPTRSNRVQQLLF